MRVFAKSYLFGGNADARQIRTELSESCPGALVQTFRNRDVSNGFFVRMLAAQTLRAERSGCLLAKKPEMDFLLRLAGTSQISEAISQVGSRPGEPFVLILASLSPLKGEPVVRAPPLVSQPLSKSELQRVELAALLTARRA